MYYRTDDENGLQTYVLDNSVALEVDKKKSVNFLPAVIKVDPKADRIVSTSYVMMQERKTVSNALKELSRLGFSFKNASLFSKKVYSFALMLKEFEPYFKADGNKPVVELIDKDGKKRAFNLLDILSKSRVQKSIDWQKSTKLYKNKDFKVEMEEARKVRKWKRNENIWEIKIPKSFVISISGTERQKNEFGSFLHLNHKKEYEAFLFEMKDARPLKIKKEKEREIRSIGSRMKLCRVMERGL